ncbi:MerR family transcriptional regulator [Mariniluteicoccus endophyticus]
MPGPMRSIGQVLTILKSDFPDISISKIRFLESEGLVSPERAPSSGYRKYSEHDVERLRYILTVQKNHYLPLKVIREHLDMMDRGMAPPRIEPPTPAAESPVAEAGPDEPTGARAGNITPAQAQKRPPLRMSRRELLAASGLSEPQLIELEKELLVTPRRGTSYYGREAVTIAIAARRLAEYGIDARHLRQVKSYAQREYSLIEQAVAPYQRRASSRPVAQEATQLMIHVHAAMMRIAADR